MALSGALGYIGLADPHDPASIYPPCPFKWLTGWNCPFCGGLRMTHDLLHGDLWAAVHDNVFLLAAVPTLAAFLLVRRARAGERCPRRRCRRSSSPPWCGQCCVTCPPSPCFRLFSVGNSTLRAVRYVRAGTRAHDYAGSA
ncbi:hypothetical protein I549_3084 [Mycobacterium avium subsp. avium 2285 (R)]|nr:hypothetical protein I549_3084 [Mycobacterium avium subsp. avium 2285 (R)]